MNPIGIVELLRFEEGWRDRPYVDTLGYPTVGYGFKLGPKIPGTKAQRHAECTRLYDFTVPQVAGDAWLLEIVRGTYTEMLKDPAINAALKTASTPGLPTFRDPRTAVLISMAFQMGVQGLAAFRNTLIHIANGDWFMAESGMLKSKWANQTPDRARRHARQMRTGQWAVEYS